MAQNFRHRLLAWLGIEAGPVSHTERAVSAAGGFTGIFLILLISRQYLAPMEAVLIVASMGASAVLLFAVPHGALSQPWPVLGGHLLSALVGVTCAQLIPDAFLAAGAAVGLAIGVMHYARCIHPPGGATALSAVVSGPAVLAMGYQYVLTPVMLNALVIFAVAVVFNYPFPWRRYPAALVRRTRTHGDDLVAMEAGTHIRHEDLVYALAEIDSFIDVNEHDLLRIYSLATEHSERSHLAPDQIRLGRFYCNGRFGEDWAVRQVVDEAAGRGLPDEPIIFKVVAGDSRRTSATTTRGKFARWAAYEVVRDETTWRRVADEPVRPYTFQGAVS